jgi:hypothetical protein
MRLPGSDATALGQITWAAESGTPLSPAQLSRLLGMTTGATTILLNRLETAGHIRRSRESTDRRRVTLRPAPPRGSTPGGSSPSPGPRSRPPCTPSIPQTCAPSPRSGRDQHRDRRRQPPFD